MTGPAIEMPDAARLAEFCRRWRIVDLAVFGSALRNDFGPDSDIDLLVTFAADADWSLLDHVRMETELNALFRREVVRELGVLLPDASST